MKWLVIIILFLAVGNLALAQRGVPADAFFVVRDDVGQAVRNANIEGGFRDVSNTGSRDRFWGATDTNGFLRAQGTALVGVGGRITAHGYYQTIAEVRLNAKDRKSIKEVWNVEVPVLLKRTRNPIPMYVKEVRNPYVSMREGGGKYLLAMTSGYDLLKGAFLPPYGNGEVADLSFDWKMNIASKNGHGRAVDYDSRCEIRMTNVVDGISRGKPDGSEDGQSGSGFISDYSSPLDGYQSQVAYYRNVRGDKVDSNDDNHYLYYFRIRTQTNEMGQVTNALYGKIYGKVNKDFIYFLNPTPNDRNLEFDPKRNLFQNLKSTERVNMP